MSLMLRLAVHIRAQGPGVPYATHDVAQALGCSRNNAATYLRRAAERGWIETIEAGTHGGSQRRPRGSVVVRYVSTDIMPPAPPPLVCSRCGVNPPRYAKTRAIGRVPICQPCLREKWKEKYQKRRGRCTEERLSTAEPERGHEDISPEAIERRYQAALAQIRRRA